MIRLASRTRDARLAAIAALLDGGTQGGQLLLFEGELPGDGIPATPAVATVRLPKPCTQQLAGGVLTLASVPEQLCQRSGLVGWGRLADGDGRPVLDLVAGLVGNGAPLQLSALQLYQGGAVRVQQIEFRE